MGYLNKLAFSALLVSGMVVSATSSDATSLSERKMIDVDPTQKFVGKYEGDKSYKEAMLTIKPKVDALKNLHNVMYKLRMAYNQARVHEMVFDHHRYTVEQLKENTRLNVMALEPFFDNADVLWGAPQHLGGPGHTKYASVGESIPEADLKKGALDDWHFFTKFVRTEMDAKIKKIKDDEILGLKVDEKYNNNPRYIENAEANASQDIYSMTDNGAGDLEAIAHTPGTFDESEVKLKDIPDGSSSDADDAMEELYISWKAGNAILKGLYADQQGWENKSLKVKVKTAFPQWRDQRQQFYYDWINYFTNIQQCYLNAAGGEIPYEYYEKGWPLMPQLTSKAFHYGNEAYLDKTFKDFKKEFDTKFKQLTGSSAPNCSAEFATNVPKVYAPLPPWRENVFFAYAALYGTDGKVEDPDIRRMFASHDSWIRMGNGYEQDMWKSWVTNGPSVVAYAGADSSSASASRYYREPAAHWHELAQLISGRADVNTWSASKYPPYSKGGVFGYEPDYYKDSVNNPVLPLNSNRINDWYEIMEEEETLRQTRQESRHALLRLQRELVNEIMQVTTEINTVFGLNKKGLDVHKILKVAGGDVYTVYDKSSKVRGMNKNGPVAAYGPGANKCEIEEYGIKKSGYDYLEHNLDDDGCYRYWLFNDNAYKAVFSELKKLKDTLIANADTDLSISYRIDRFKEKYPKEVKDKNHPTKMVVDGVTKLTPAGNHLDMLGFTDYLELMKKDSTAMMNVSGGNPILNNDDEELMLWPWEGRKYKNGDETHGIPDPTGFIKITKHIKTLNTEDEVRESSFVKTKEDFYDITLPSVKPRGPSTLTRIVDVSSGKDLTTNKAFSKKIAGAAMATAPSQHCSGSTYRITPDGSFGCSETEKMRNEGFFRSATADFPFTDTHFVQPYGDDYKYNTIGGVIYQGTLVKADTAQIPSCLGPQMSKNQPLRLTEDYFVNANARHMSPCDKYKWTTSGSVGGYCDLSLLPGQYINSYNFNDGSGYGEGYGSELAGIAPNLTLAPYSSRLIAYNVIKRKCMHEYSISLSNYALSKHQVHLAKAKVAEDAAAKAAAAAAAAASADEDSKAAASAKAASAAKAAAAAQSAADAAGNEATTAQNKANDAAKVASDADASASADVKAARAAAGS